MSPPEALSLWVVMVSEAWCSRHLLSLSGAACICWA